MRLIYVGGQETLLRSFLDDAGVTDIAVSFRTRKQKWDIMSPHAFDQFSENFRIHLYPGNPPLESQEDLEEFCAEYEQAVDFNLQYLTSFTDVPFPSENPEFHTIRQKEFYDQYDPQMYRPWWREGQSVFALEELAERYPHVLMHKDMLSVLDDQSLLGVFSTDYETQFHLFGLHKVQPEFRFETIYQGTWYAPRRYGSTVLWDGKKLHNVNHTNQVEFREKHRPQVRLLGLNQDLVVANDLAEVTRLSLESLKEYEKYVNRTPEIVYLTYKFDPPKPTDDPEPVISESDNLTTAVVIPSSTPVSDLRYKSHFPGVKTRAMTSIIEGENGTVIRDVPIAESDASTVRTCDGCALARGCPAYAPGEDCSFSLPLELRTRDQVIAYTQTLLEMQAARIGFARMAEELAGGMPTVETSTEIDRFVKMLKDFKKVEEQSSTTRVTIEERKSSGVLSQIFGARPGASTSD